MELTPMEQLGWIPAHSPQDSQAQLLSDHLHYLLQWALHPLLDQQPYNRVQQVPVGHNTGEDKTAQHII